MHSSSKRQLQQLRSAKAQQQQQQQQQQAGPSLQAQARALLAAAHDAPSEGGESEDDDLMGMSPELPAGLLMAAAAAGRPAGIAPGTGFPPNVFQQAFRMHAQGASVVAAGGAAVTGWAPSAPLSHLGR
ncbi:hypothetical protein COO60DRAFT_1702319 [Scenedesmus sp. NREL 46B-D3]|nr:hypothetical protein COO60DRAFT_1702319 [Scenedesmus sp. NREL 46B-D3]